MIAVCKSDLLTGLNLSNLKGEKVQIFNNTKKEAKKPKEKPWAFC